MFIRFIIWTIVIYFAARFFWRVLDSFTGGARPTSTRPHENSRKPERTVEYKDVEDAKFTDVPASSENRPPEDRDLK